MNWFGGEIRVTFIGGAVRSIYDIPFDQQRIAAAMAVLKIDPNTIREVMYFPYPIAVEFK